MNKKFNYRLILKYLFIPGLILSVAGLVASLITKVWTPLHIAFMITGGIFLVTWLLFVLITGQSFWRKRSTQAGTNALVSTLSFILILGLINFLAVRYSPRIDLTENQLFTLSPQSQEVVENLKNPVKVWLFVKEPNSTDKDLLENYRRYSKNFEFEFVDPDIKVGLRKQFNVNSLGDVYVEYGEKKQLVQTLVATDSQEPLSEAKLTNAIEKIQRDYTPSIYFLQGHGEYPLAKTQEGSLSDAVSSLKNKGYNVKPLNLVENSVIPSDADAIVIAGAKRKLFPQEVQLLKTYSDQGGNLLLLLDPNTDPGLEPLLKAWGVQLDNRIIIDGSGAGNVVGLGPTTPFITTYGNHPITKEFSNGISFYPLSRPIDTVKVKDIEATSLLVTSDQMWAESDLASEEVTFNPNEDISGPFDLGVALTRKINGGDQKQSNSSKVSPSPSPNSESSSNQEKEAKNTPTPASSPSAEKTESNPTSSSSPTVDTTKTPKTQTPSSSSEANPQKSESSSEKITQEKPKKTEARLVVIGNSTFATDNLFNQQLNGDIFLNSVQWLENQDAQTLSIRPKETKNRRINLSPLTANLLNLLSLVVVPLLGLGAALITWWRRR